MIMYLTQMISGHDRLFKDWSILADFCKVYEYERWL